MIIANIGHQDYELATIADAEELLKIFERAKAVRREYGAGVDHYYREDHSVSMSIEISGSKLVTIEQHNEYQAAAKQASELKRVAA